VRVGWKPNRIAKKTSSVFFFFVTVVLGVILSAQTAFAHDATAPVRLDFDVRGLPKNCNDDVTFRALLTEWIGRTLLIPEADRRLMVRINRSPTGGKLADVMLVDAVGATIAQEHMTFARNTECYKVLYVTARVAAKLLGAFDKPPPPEPVVTPAPLPSPAPAEPAPCPTCPAPALPPPPVTRPASFTRRAFIGAGVFLGMTTTSEASVGPAVSLGFVPVSRWPGFQIEFDGAYASRNVRQGFHVDTVPVFVSLCHEQVGVRLCGGMTSTLFFTEDPTNARDFMFSASLRIGTQFELAGPFSIRADAFALLPLTQRTTLDSPNPFAAGTTVMGVWSFD
jgi:hypothetical protein